MIISINVERLFFDLSEESMPFHSSHPTNVSHPIVYQDAYCFQLNWIIFAKFSCIRDGNLFFDIKIIMENENFCAWDKFSTSSWLLETFRHFCLLSHFFETETKRNWTWFSLNDNNASLFLKSYWNGLILLPSRFTQYKLTSSSR